MNTDKIIAEINQLRRSSKNRWYWYSNNHIHLKGFGTWIQRMKIDGYETQFDTMMDLSVSEFNARLTSILTTYPPIF